MQYLEENLSPHDVFIFELNKSIHPNHNIADFIEYSNDNTGISIVSSIVHDNDLYYFDMVRERGLDVVLEGLINDVISVVWDGEDEHHPDVVHILNNDAQGFGYTMLYDLSRYHSTVLCHLENIFITAKQNNINYVDFTLSEAENKIVLRLLKGIMPC